MTLKNYDRKTYKSNILQRNFDNIQLIHDDRNTKIHPEHFKSQEIQEILEMVRNTVNANVVFPISFVKEIDRVRGDVCRSRFVLRAVEKYLKDKERVKIVES